MFDDFYGLTGKPFQLTPDPAFYFPSITHRKALSYLGYGLAQGEGFIVVTGEIGAGKTTLVRTLLEGLNPEQVVAAQVVSTQLESGELLQAILMSFGIASSSNSKAHLIGSLEAFLTSLAAKGRRALRRGGILRSRPARWPCRVLRCRARSSARRHARFRSRRACW